MELNKYTFPLRKWWWLVAASTLIALIFSSLSALRQPAIYQARTTLMIGTTINDPNPSSAELSLGQQLAAAYADLANREILRNATRNALGMNRLPAYFAWALPNTQLIEITVNDTDRQRAQIVANELAAQLILLSPISGQTEEQERQEFIHERLNNLEIQIQETESEIEKLQAELANTFSAQEINDKQSQISSLELKLNTLENNYGLLVSNTQQGATNTLTIIAAAELPGSPIASMRGVTILLATVAGFVLAAGTAYLLEYMDDTLKSPDNVMRLFSAPILGRIFEQEGRMKESQFYDAENSNHPLTEPFRALRTEIDLAEMGQRLKTILVTSPDIGDGKTSVAANLALSISQRGKKVFLLDADLRKPKIHKIFNLPNEEGLADVVFARAVFDWRIGIKEFRQISVLTAGDTPPDPAELLSSEKMGLFLSELEQVADTIIIDGPPLFVPDAMILASKVDGVLLVVRPTHTRQSLAKAAMEHIKLVGAKVVGVVLNRIPLRGADYYAGKSYLFTYYSSNYGNENQASDSKNFGGSFFFSDIQNLWEISSPYINKVTTFFRQLPASLRSRFQTKS
ncbi:MAG TPA: polysaccharide biosynthesis tyrosine autokinase [Anaerolineales bacterium]|nr:polysaccharide biosynthesis tyrosine autokinase [Anaerolineales bacterium]